MCIFFAERNVSEEMKLSKTVPIIKRGERREGRRETEWD
jgi:hypothetical protein